MRAYVVKYTSHEILCTSQLKSACFLLIFFSYRKPNVPCPKSPVVCQKSPIFCQKSPTFFQKKNLKFCQKSPVIWQKIHTHTLELVYCRERFIDDRKIRTHTCSNSQRPTQEACPRRGGLITIVDQTY